VKATSLNFMGALSRILIIKLGSLGDVVHTLPAVAALKKSHPETQIDWLVERKCGVLLRNNPLVHEVIEVDTQQWRKSLLSPQVLGQLKALARRLRNNHYDVALDFQGLWKSAAFGYFSGAKRVVGFDKRVLKEPGCSILYDTRILPRAQATHVIDIYGELVHSLGAETNGLRFDLNTSENDDAYVSTQLALLQVDDFVILNPGGGWITKNWDPENYAALHLRLRQTTRLQTLLTWGPGEEHLIEQIVRHCKQDPPVTFPTTIPQFIALVRRARLFVGGDTGPMHLASACGVPVVGIFGPTDPLRNGPFSEKDIVVSHRVPCGPCYKRSCKVYNKECMRLVTVDEVHKAVLQRLSLP
jgi:lipopolysaccharide heptosyltransferase I